MHEHIHGPDCKPKTAAQEAMVQLAQGMEYTEKKFMEAKWYQFGLKNQLRGMLAGFTTALMLLDRLDQKYNNDNGDLN